jgi:hypothetical protein
MTKPTDPAPPVPPEEKRAERVEEVLVAVAARRAVVAFMDMPRAGARERARTR